MTAPYIRVSSVLAAFALFAAPVFAQMNPRTDSLFTISGFVPQIANTPEKLKHLRALPPDRLITRTRNGKTTYLYADPNICQCVYVGTPEAYRTYQNGGPEGYVGDESNKGSPRFPPRVLMGEMENDPYVNDPGAPSLDDYLFNTP
jgi:hypothetical protein